MEIKTQLKIGLKHLSDEDLLIKTKSLVSEESKLTEEVLKYLCEIDIRKIYLAKGFSSLFEFCIKELKYSEGSACRRIASMRLIRDVPEALSGLQKQKVNLSTLSKLQGAIKREEKRTGFKMKGEAKVELLESIAGKSQRECDLELLKSFPLDSIPKETKKVLSSEFTELKLTASNRLIEKLEKLKSLLAHSKNKPQTESELIEILADMALRKLDPVLASRKTNPAAAVKGARTYIHKELKRRVWLKSEKKCQYIDPVTDRKCESTYALQIDHIKPLYFGGETQLDNLRLLCRNHNLWLGQQILEI